MLPYFNTNKSCFQCIDYKKAYTDFINSGSYKKSIGANILICYAVLPSDRNGSYDLLMNVASMRRPEKFTIV